MFSVAALSLVLLLGFQRADAFFRMPCHDKLVVERVDPILSPGAAAGHLHTVMGGDQNGHMFNASYTTARASTCSTCAAKADLSAYWTPTLYFQDTEGKFTPVPQVGGATVYYLQRRGDNKEEPLKAFPPDFRMVAGDAKRRSFTAGDKAQEAVTHVCLDFKNTGAGGEFPEIPPHHCPEGMRTQVFFPSCWNGEVDSDNHKSHVSYPETGRFNGGDCPASHPIHLISIFYEIHWDTSSFKDKFHAGFHGTGHPYVLSTGDPTGYGFHGDFLNGWDQDILQRAVDECTNNSGSMDDCPVLERRTDDEMKSCKVDSRINEPIGLDGPLDKLPGCNDVFAGPGEATMKPPSACGAITMPDGSPGEPAPQPNPTESESAPEPIPTNTTETQSDTPVLTETTIPNEPPSTETPVETETETESSPEETSTPTEDEPAETSTGAPPAPPAPTAGPVSGWSDLGCYVDPVNPRALNDAKAAGPTMTPSYCQEWCGKRGFIYAANEHGGECFCGNELSAGAVPAESSKCDMKCEGDASFSCGGAGFMNLYQLGGASADPSITSAPAPFPTETDSTSSTTTRTRKYHWNHWNHWNRRSPHESSARRMRRNARLH